MLGALAAVRSYSYVSPILTELAAAWCRRQGAFGVANARAADRVAVRASASAEAVPVESRTAA